MSEYVLVSQGIECNRSNNPYEIISYAIKGNKDYNEYLERCIAEHERPADNEMFVYKEERDDTTEVDLFEMEQIIKSAKAEVLAPIAKIIDDFACGRTELSLTALNQISHYIAKQFEEAEKS